MENNQDKISHLQMIQSIVDRMGKNSFSLKGWAVGVMVAIYAFAGQNYNKAVIVTLIPLIIFWILDSYYLMLERKYRRLYDEVRLKENNKIDFDMNFNNVSLKMKEIKKFEFIRKFFSKTEWPFYLVCITVTLIIYFVKF